jgi:hypothetical protein
LPLFLGSRVSLILPDSFALRPCLPLSSFSSKSLLMFRGDLPRQYNLFCF